MAAHDRRAATLLTPQLDDAILDAIDAIAPPGTDAGPNEVADVPPDPTDPRLRRSPAADRPTA